LNPASPGQAGRIVTLAGDGALAEFPGAVEAVFAGAE
jgi:hypothetical protein